MRYHPANASSLKIPVPYCWAPKWPKLGIRWVQYWAHVGCISVNKRQAEFNNMSWKHSRILWTGWFWSQGIMPRLFPCRDVLYPSQDEPSFGSPIANQKHIISSWYLATLNVRTLLEEQGRIGSSYMQLIVKLNVVVPHYCLWQLTNRTRRIKNKNEDIRSVYKLPKTILFQHSIGGSVVESLPAMQGTWVRFPVNVNSFTAFGNWIHWIDTRIDFSSRN